MQEAQPWDEELGVGIGHALYRLGMGTVQATCTCPTILHAPGSTASERQRACGACNRSAGKHQLVIMSCRTYSAA